MKAPNRIILSALVAVGVGAASVIGAAYAHDGGDRQQYRQFKSGAKGPIGHGGPSFGPGGPMHGMLEAYDSNGDGKLTQQEIDAARADQLRKFDADGDGGLNLDEYRALWLDAMRERMVDRFQAHDDDGDGKVTAEEFGERFSRMVRHMDRNGDGTLDDGDRGPRHGERRHHRHHDDD